MTYPFLGKLKIVLRWFITLFAAVECVGLALDKDTLPNKSATNKAKLEFKVPKPYGLQKAFCRFHRRGSATLVKVFNIGCSICNLPCKPATKFRFGFKTW